VNGRNGPGAGARARALLWAGALAAGIGVLTPGCGDAIRATLPFSGSTPSAVLQLRVQHRAPRPRAAAAPLPRIAVSLDLEIGNPADPDFRKPPAFDISGPAGVRREATVVDVPPGRQKRVFFLARSVDGSVVASGTFFVDLFPGQISSNDLDLGSDAPPAPGGAGPPASGSPSPSPSASGSPSPSPSPSGSPGVYFVIESSNAKLVKIDTNTSSRTVIFSFTTPAPRGLARDAGGNFIACEFGPPAAISLITQGGARTQLNTEAIFNAPTGVVVRSNGNYVFTDGFEKLQSIPAGGGAPSLLSNFGAMSNPEGVALDGSGNYIVCVAGSDPKQLLRVDPSGAPQTVVLNYLTDAPGFTPRAVTIDANGDYIVAEDTGAVGMVSRVTPAGVRTTIAALLAVPKGIIRDTDGNFIVTQASDNLDRVTPGGVRTTIFTFPAGSNPFGIVQ
jgi:hypothetical protein